MTLAFSDFFYRKLPDDVLLIGPPGHLLHKTKHALYVHLNPSIDFTKIIGTKIGQGHYTVTDCKPLCGWGEGTGYEITTEINDEGRKFEADIRQSYVGRPATTGDGK